MFRNGIARRWLLNSLGVQIGELGHDGVVAHPHRPKAVQLLVGALAVSKVLHHIGHLDLELALHGVVWQHPGEKELLIVGMGGEQQKVMIARALVQEPAVLLLDEPTSSLDPRNQIETMSLIRKAAKEDGITVLIVLHDLNLALRFCDRFFFMKDGRGIRYCRADEVDGGTIRASYGVDADIATINGERFVMIRQEDIYGHE